MNSPRELGIPVKSINWARVFAGQRCNGEPLILMVAGQDNGGLFVCDVDLETGHCVQYAVGLENARFPTAVHFSTRTSTLYIGSAYTGHLHRYDASLPQEHRRLEDLGTIDPDLCGFPCAIDEAPDGSIYIGAHPGCCLTRFDPTTSTFVRFGRMTEDEMYFYPACGRDGTVAGLAKTREPRVIVFDPRTSTHRAVGPRVSTEAGEKIELRKGIDGLLYILSPRGNFQLKEGEALPVENVPEATPASTLPDGSRIEFLDGHRHDYRKLQIASPSGTARVLELDWQGGGTGIFLVHAGPDEKIYGSSILPEHLFVCEQDGSGIIDLGVCSESIGEAYSMANYDGKIYLASYPGARISIYDPRKPYDYGTEARNNPRDIGRLDEVSCRPRAMLAGPGEKIWIGSYPDYGMLGGTLCWLDPSTLEKKSHRHIVRDCSVTALEWMPELDAILIGTSIIGGNGTQPQAERAPFVLWNPYEDSVIWTGDFGLEINDSILDIKYSGDGYVLAVVTRCIDEQNKSRPLEAELVLIDVLNKKVLDRSPFVQPDWPIEVSLRADDNGVLYGCTSASIYRVRPGTAQRVAVWSIPHERAEEHIHAPGALIGRQYFFGSGHRLRVLDLPSAMP
jgi:hypothetical protein